MSDYGVERVGGAIRIDPDAGGEGRRRKEEKSARKARTADSVSISEEARRRSGEQEGDAEG